MKLTFANCVVAMTHLDTVLDENEGGHGSDVVRLGTLLVDIDIDLEEDDVRLRLGHLFDHGS